ncbi:MAG: hypothetical protein K1X74_07700 [Pirellulales bacterium]|nr:hypothetical protein [Pirellulales bacterium]
MNGSSTRGLFLRRVIAHVVYRAVLAAATLLVGTALFAGTGCSRAFALRQADLDAYARINEKINDPRWDLQDYSINIDSRSRLFDPTCKVAPAMPPDDPVSHRLMHCVDDKHGFCCWHLNGDIDTAENPNWAAFLPTNEDGVLVLDLRGTVDVARLNSRNYQNQLEQLYLSALDVAFERFRFDTQFFAGYGIDYQSEGEALNSFGSASKLRLRSQTPARAPVATQATRLFASGGTLVVGLANQIMWQLSGPDSYQANTLAAFTFVQPLLRAGSRAVVLERLTLAERTLLANVRQMERYRQGFFVNVYTGRDPGQGPQRRGGFFGGSGLEGFSGIGTGGFGRVGGAGGSGGGGGGFAGGAGAAQANGYLGLLQDQLQIRNQEANVAGLRASLAQLEAAYEAGRIDNRLQVEQTRQALFNAQSVLLNTKAAFDTALDAYKVNLGLPPNLLLEINDRLLDQFNLLDPELTDSQNTVLDALEQLRTDDPESGGLAAGIRAAQEGARLEAAHLAIVERDMETLREALPRRRETLDRLIGREEVKRGDVDRSAYDSARLAERFAELERDLTDFQKRSGDTRTRVEQLAQEAAADRPEVRQQLIGLLSDLADELFELSLVQGRIRLDSTNLIRVELDANEAFRIARVNRLDLMNARASLVDSWRLIEFNANQLRSDVDFVFDGDISSTDDNPFRFRNTTGRLRVGLEFDAPLTRLSERNLYRQSLIEFQQARRNYYASEDGIRQGLRLTLRTIDLNALNFELRREAVLVALEQVDLTRLNLKRPPQPGQTSEQLGATTARDLLSALSDLLNVQNDFLSVWVNTEVQRVSLDFDLGTILLDEHGMWIDPGAITGDSFAAKHLSGDDCQNTVGPEWTDLPAELQSGSRPESVEPPAQEELPQPEAAAPLLRKVSHQVSVAPRQPAEVAKDPANGPPEKKTVPQAWKPARRELRQNPGSGSKGSVSSPSASGVKQTGWIDDGWVGRDDSRATAD